MLFRSNLGTKNHHTKWLLLNSLHPNKLNSLKKGFISSGSSIKNEVLAWSNSVQNPVLLHPMGQEIGWLCSCCCVLFIAFTKVKFLEYLQAHNFTTRAHTQVLPRSKLRFIKVYECSKLELFLFYPSGERGH